MAASIDDYEQTYQQAYKAYVQRNYEDAATLIDQVVQNLPNDPSTHLLRGHIYYVLQQYEVAKDEYQLVLQLTNDPEIIGFAQNGLENINQSQQQGITGFVVNERSPVPLSDFVDDLSDGQQVLEDLGTVGDLDSNDFDLNFFGEHQQDAEFIEKLSSGNPFEMPADSTIFGITPNSSATFGDYPFALNPQGGQESWEQPQDYDLPAFWQQDISEASSLEPEVNHNSQAQSENAAIIPNDKKVEPFTPSESEKNSESFNFKAHNFEDETLLMGLMGETATSGERKTTNYLGSNRQESVSHPSSLNSNFIMDEKDGTSSSASDHNSFNDNDSFDFQAFESAFDSDELPTDEVTNCIVSEEISQGQVEFLNDFEEFDDLGKIPGIDITSDSSFDELEIPSDSLDISGKSHGNVLETFVTNETSNVETTEREDELFNITGSQQAVPVFTQKHVRKVEPKVSVEQGFLAPLENAPLEKKPWIIAGTVGIVSALAVAGVSFAATTFSPTQQRESVRNTGWAMALAAGIAGFATTGVLGNLALKQVRRSSKDLQNQFDAVRQGNLNVQATVYSEDEFGQLAVGFNEMARVVFTTTNEAQRKAAEQEQAKENLQRQVIHLLDDVEGAARGDLTVQAEVTADVLGAVADAFNLTIQNLRDIVQQVKVTARDVTKGATNSETFARALSSDALRQAEELAQTLNSVQVMTDSIQRVAEAAREAETVARNASAIALKGGEAVENTVAGILEIRETVAETTRKVKRLAESSQEISKIVALISQIASRTNLLALNASIEAARAGDAGRGFAIVADEVRQLADKSAKSLKEIEQIVMQIQSETGSVMTAMEEGTQQVIKGTKLAEDAKRSLENIIQVANRIDTLVCSITADTVEQTETSRAVAQVMQSVELTAQDTSQEAQRVSGALQHLVSVSRDLIASVERFRVETTELRSNS